MSIPPSEITPPEESGSSRPDIHKVSLGVGRALEIYNDMARHEPEVPEPPGQTICAVKDLLDVLVESEVLIHKLSRGSTVPPNQEVPLEAEGTRTVALRIDGRLITSEMLGLTHPRDLELLAVLSTFQQGRRFTTKDVLGKGLYSESSPRAARQAFVVSKKRVLPALNDATGRQLIIQAGKKGGSYYELAADIVRAPEEEKLLPPDEPQTDRALVKGDQEMEHGEQQITKPGADELRDLLKPHVMSALKIRTSKAKPSARLVAPHMAGSNNTTKAAMLHWGLGSKEEPLEPADVETIAMILRISPHSAKTMVKETVKELCMDSDTELSSAAKKYLEYLDGLDV